MLALRIICTVICAISVIVKLLQAKSEVMNSIYHILSIIAHVVIIVALWII